jgi:hypothetical protein
MTKIDFDNLRMEAFRRSIGIGSCHRGRLEEAVETVYKAFQLPMPEMVYARGQKTNWSEFSSSYTFRHAIGVHNRFRAYGEDKQFIEDSGAYVLAELLEVNAFPSFQHYIGPMCFPRNWCEEIMLVMEGTKSFQMSIAQPYTDPAQHKFKTHAIPRFVGNTKRRSFYGYDVLEYDHAWLTILTNVWAARALHDRFEVIDWPADVFHDEIYHLTCTSDRPAVTLKSGKKLWIRRGMHIPDQFADVRMLHPRDFLHMDDQKLRDDICAEYGWYRIFEHIGADLIHRRADPEWGSLIEMHLPKSEPKRFLKVLCGTGRWFCLPVPSDVMTVEDAQELINNNIPFWMLRASKRRT